MSAPVPAERVSSWLTCTCAAAICASAWASAIRNGRGIDPEQQSPRRTRWFSRTSTSAIDARSPRARPRPCPAGHRHCRSRRSGRRSARNSRRRASSSSGTDSISASAASASRACGRRRVSGAARRLGRRRVSALHLGIRFAHDACSSSLDPVEIGADPREHAQRGRPVRRRKCRSSMSALKPIAHRLELGDHRRRRLRSDGCARRGGPPRRGAARPAGFLEPVDHPAQRDRLDVERFGELDLAQRRRRCACSRASTRHCALVAPSTAARRFASRRISRAVSTTSKAKFSMAARI